MNCSIKNTLASKIIQTSSRPVEPGYFDTEKFIKQFGEWRAGPLSEAQIADNISDKQRFNEDGSPRLDVNKYGITFFIDKKGVRTPIIGEEFSTLPLDIRSEVSEEIMNAVVADLLLDHLIDNEDFLAGKRVEDFNLDEYFEERTNAYWDWGMTDQALISTKESKQDYLDGINAKLRNLGVKVETDAIKQAQSIERPTTDKASPTIKALMQFVPRVDSAGERIDSVNIPDNPTFMKPSEVWGATLAHMADIPMQEDKNMVDVYMAKLQELAVTHPWAKEVHNELEQGSDTLRLQFVSAMNNVKNNVNITEYDKGLFTTKNAVASSTSRSKVTSEWVTVLTNTVDGLTKDQIEHIALDVIPDAQEAIENIPVPTEATVAEALLDLHEALAPMFTALNIGIDENLTMAAFNEQVKRLYNGKDEEVNYIDAYKSFATLLSDSWLPVISTAVSSPTAENLEQFTNAMVTFAQGQVNVEDDSGVHMVTVGKNRIYVYSLPSVLQETINAWKNNPAMVQELIEDPTVANSQFLQHFANPNNLAKLKVGMRGVITTTSSTGRTDSKDGGDISKGDYAKVDFYNVLRILGDDNKNVPIYNTQVPADKGKEFQFEAPGLFRHTKNSKEAADIFSGYIRDEFNQMRAAERYISNEIDSSVNSLPEGILKSMFEELTTSNPDISSAARLSLLVQSINSLDGPTRVDLKDLVGEVKKTMTVNYHLFKDTLIDMDPSSENLGRYPGGAFNYSTAASINDIEGLRHPVSGLPLPQTDLVLIEDKKMASQINDKLEAAIKNKIDSFKEEALSKYGIHYDLSSSIGIDRKIVEHYEKIYEDIVDPIVKADQVYDAMMRDFVVNYMMSKIEYAKLFTGDLSFYKGVSDYIKRVPATYIDGLQPVTGLEEGDATFTQMTFATEELNDMELSYPESGLATEVRAHYVEVDRTDAQGYITPKRWRQLINSVGKMGSEAQQVYDKIMKQGEYVKNNKSIPSKYMLTAKEIKVLSAQPLKGVYFKNEIGGVPTYLKYSQAVLLPQFVANNPKAKTLLAYMEDHGIDEMVAQTGVKVGATRPTQLFDTEGNFVAPTSPVLNTLDARNWRLQQDLPTKTIKDNKIGVQVQKIIMSGLAFSGDTVLLQDIENALGDLSNAGLDTFYSRYGITVGTNGSAKITDIPTFYSSLIKDVQAKEVPENNTLKALKAETPISLLPMLKDSLQSQIFSTIRKAATNLMTPGGAYIQISDQLIGKTEIERRGITMLVDSLDRLKPPRLSGRTVIPGQVLIPHSMIAEYIPNYQDMTPAELRDAIPEELREIIGYRIPTQAKASVDLLEIVGILPIELGDSIITYGEITAKTGSDFDIDKMFFMMRQLELSEDGKIQAVPAYIQKETAKQEAYMKDVVIEEEEVVPLPGVKGVNKPTLNVELMTNKELVELDDAKAIITHSKLEKEVQDLEDLISCIWK